MSAMNSLNTHVGGNEGKLPLTGAGSDQVIRSRMHRLARRLAAVDESPEAILDFGCGTGTATPHFFDVLGAERVHGIDTSAESLAAAENGYGRHNVRFSRTEEFVPSGEFDLVFTYGVLHRLTPAERAAAFTTMYAALDDGGLLAFWEGNPWNVIARRNPSHPGGKPIWPHHARRLIREAGFRVLRTDFVFLVPRFLNCLEPHVCKVALGTEYLILAQKR